MKTIEERFWPKVKKTKKCWLWAASKFRLGYGSFKISTKKNIGAHRASWIIHFGNIPENMNVLHKCDVRSCVNPDHLFLGTHSDNMRDMKNKGRARSGMLSGEDCRQSVLKKYQVLEILSCKKYWGMQAHFAKKFNVNPKTISDICNRKNWRHLKPE